MKIYQVVQGSGEWEDYHEWVVYTTTDRAKAEYIKRAMTAREERLMARKYWEPYYDPASYRVEAHDIDRTDSEFAFLDTMLNQRGKLRSQVFFSRSVGIEDNIDEVLKQDIERMISA